MTSHPFWRAAAPLVLASGSAARRALLEAAAVPHDVRPADIDERTVEIPLRAAGAAPEAVAAHLARAKALAVAAAWPGRTVLGADQVLALGPEMFTKPGSISEARAQLERLAGRSHALHSSFCLVRDQDVLGEGVAMARLDMRPLSAAFLDAYLAAEGETVRTTVGAYRLEGLGAHLFSRIEGDTSTILGLPLLPLLAVLRDLGMLLD